MCIKKGFILSFQSPSQGNVYLHFLYMLLYLRYLMDFEEEEEADEVVNLKYYSSLLEYSDRGPTYKVENSIEYCFFAKSINKRKCSNLTL